MKPTLDSLEILLSEAEFLSVDKNSLYRILIKRSSAANPKEVVIAVDLIDQKRIHFTLEDLNQALYDETKNTFEISRLGTVKFFELQEVRPTQ
jgi:hypothetical protein